MKGKEETSERIQNEKETSQLSDIQFTAMVIRKFNELTENYQKLQGNYNELTANYINMKKEIKTINKGQEEMKSTISELKNTEEGIKPDQMKQNIGSVSWRTMQKKTPRMSKKRKRGSEKNEEGLREMQDNVKIIIISI